MHISRAITRVEIVSNNWKKVIERSQNRIGIILSTTKPNEIAIVFGNPNEYNLPVGMGHLLSSANSPLLLVFGLNVPVVQGEVYASIDGTVQELVITEIFAADDCAERVTRTGLY
jgi:hypothetical protein